MKALLALLVLTLAAVLVWQWREWPPSAPGPDSADAQLTPAETPAQPTENPLDLLTPLEEKDEYLIVTERPLFRPERRPLTEEPEEGTAAESEPPSDLARLDLNAILITPSESSAWIRDPTKKELVRLRPGDDLGGWSVLEIHTDRLLLERQGEKDTLVLRDYKNMPPPQRKPTARQPQQKSPRAAVKRPSPATQMQGADRKQVNENRRDAIQPLQTRNPRANAMQSL